MVEDPSVRISLSLQPPEVVGARLDLKPVHRSSQHGEIGALVCSRDPQLIDELTRPSHRIEQMLPQCTSD